MEIVIFGIDFVSKKGKLGQNAACRAHIYPNNFSFVFSISSYHPSSLSTISEESFLLVERFSAFDSSPTIKKTLALTRNDCWNTRIEKSLVIKDSYNNGFRCCMYM
jgi:hypothetical protein